MTTKEVKFSSPGYRVIVTMNVSGCGFIRYVDEVGQLSYSVKYFGSLEQAEQLKDLSPDTFELTTPEQAELTAWIKIFGEYYE